MSKGRKVIATSVRGVVLAALCFALFDVPAAYVASRGYSPWLALAVGLASFPIVALVWHVVAERSRRRAPPASPKTKGWERLLLRGVVVGVVVVGALVGVAGRSRVWWAARHHALWFLPDNTGPLAADSRLFAHVPDAAQGLLWVRLSDEARAELGRVLEPIAGASDMLSASDWVIAVGDDGALFADEGDSDLVDVVDKLLSGLCAEWASVCSHVRGAKQTAPDGVRYLVTPGWADAVAKRTSASPRATLLDLVPRAPANADIVLVARPRDLSTEPVLAGLTSAVAYVRVHRGTLEVIASVDYATAADAQRAPVELDKAVAKAEAEDAGLKQGLGCWRTHGHTDVEATGAHVTFSARIPLDDVRAFVECASR